MTRDKRRCFRLLLLPAALMTDPNRICCQKRWFQTKIHYPDANGTIKRSCRSVLVDGGTFTTVGTGTIQSQDATLDGRVNTPTNSGAFVVPTGYNLSLEGTIANNGTITVDSNGCIDAIQPTTLTGSGKVVLNSGSCPWQNGIAERWVGSCRRDLLDHVIVLHERHLKRLLREYLR